METPGTNPSPLPGQQASPQHGGPLLDREAAEAYVAAICFKNGPPSLHGVELEWTVHHRSDPRRPLAADHLSTALGDHAPSTIRPGSPHLPLPAGSLVTVEPGGQVEISPSPHTSVAALLEVAATDAAALADLLASHDLVVGDHAIDAHRPPSMLLQVPRYVAMRDAFDAVGPEGRRMMCSTASVQVCLDAGEGDQIGRRWRALHCLGPALIALFANSPDINGHDTGWASSRARATLGTFPTTTSPPVSLDDPAAWWARTAMEAPVLCVRGGSHGWGAPRGLTFAGWIADPSCVGRPPTFDDLDYHLTTLFPPVRPKGYLEVRYLDMQTGTGWATPLVLLSALLNRPATIDRVLDLTGSTADLWFEAAEQGLGHPELRRAARLVVQLGADSLGHLDLTDVSRTQVRDDLAVRIDSRPSSRRCSA